MADLYEVMQGVDGVKNSVITLPASDVIIGDREVARPGTLTINVT